MSKINPDREKELQLLEGVLPKEWGTIGPHFVHSMEALGKHFGVGYGLSVFSTDVALETILRGLGIGYGDEVIIADYSDPVDTFAAVNAGVTPVFCDIHAPTLTIGPKEAETVFTEHTRAVIADIPAGNPCDAKALSAYCREKGIYLILNLQDAAGTMQDGRPIASYADAAFLDLSEKTVWGIGLAGALVTDRKEYFDLFYAYHNCGRPFGVGATISFDQILGGDFRIDEFQACLIPQRLSLADQILAQGKAEREKATELSEGLFEVVETIDGGVSSCNGTLLRFCKEESGDVSFSEAVRKLTESGLQISGRYRLMHRAPFLTDPYFSRMTGSSRVYRDEDYPESIRSDREVIDIKGCI